MTNKTETAGRGRPRSFSEADVLLRAQQVFLNQGFEATPYEDIAASTGLSKPSLYNAFGDKTALFERAIAGYAEHAHRLIMAGFANAPNLAKAGKHMLLAAADVYAAPDRPSTGCLLVGTALPACTQNDAVRNTLSGFVASLESDLEAIIASRYGADARASGKTPRALALLVSSLLFSLAVRARAGLTRRKLRATASELANILARP